MMPGPRIPIAGWLHGNYLGMLSAVGSLRALPRTVVAAKSEAAGHMRGGGPFNGIPLVLPGMDRRRRGHGGRSARSDGNSQAPKGLAASGLPAADGTDDGGVSGTW
jgi:hypothetical protein